MNVEELNNIERRLSIVLPMEYRRIMQTYPFDNSSRAAEAYLPNNSNVLCELNLQFRNDSEFAELWNSAFFCFGTTWGGDPYLLDTSLNDSPVFKASRESKSIRGISADFPSWIESLKQQALEFDPIAAETVYANLKQAIEATGYFSTSVELMDGWHRIVIASRRSPCGGLTGNSFWAACIHDAWYVGAWGGFNYRISTEIDDFCIAWLKHNPDGTSFDFDVEFKRQFKLQSLTEEEFDAAIRGD